MERQRQKQKLNTAPDFYILDSRLRGNDGAWGGEIAVGQEFGGGGNS
ncbi:MAG: hypothetical protein HAW59_02370 [Betaproteobacteria bacterium]|nr:hypothetical protein [Betaproteobacteria bacterium]